MGSIAGFLLINIYALLVILATCIMFFSKQRLQQSEDKIYKNFLLTNVFMSVSGLMFGIFVNPNYFNSSIAVIFNKLYLISLILWIFLLTIYTVHVSLKDKIMKYKKTFVSLLLISIILIIILPAEVKLNANASAVAEGASVILTYSIFGIGFLIQVASVIMNYKNLMNKKYIPLYLLITLGSAILIIQIINPSLNYLINPTLIFIAYIMYHTIENPDTKLLEEVHKSKEISDAANEEKTLFLYNMTQEIRSTTDDINDNADMILESESLEENKDCAREIKEITSRFNSITNEMFDVSKLDASSIKVYNSKYNIKNILKGIVTLYSNICKNKGLSFRVNIDHDVPEILYGDSIGLKEALSIIMENSVKYTKEGFIEFNVNTIIKGDVCRLIIAIEDSGVGIKSEDINKMKIDNKSLSKANKLITLMNGALMISSNYGFGTKVKIILDQKIELNRNENVVKYEEVYDNIKLLMVDDSDSGIKIIDKLIKGSNIKMDYAMNGKECIDKIRAYNKYDIILLDEQLSQISAIELIRKVKDIRNFATPVILLTKDNSYEYNDELKKIGFSDYLLKPIKKEELLNKINEYAKKDK